MIKKIIEVAVNEFNVLKQRKRDLVVMIGSPLLFLILFGFLYSQNVVNHINTVIFDQDNTSLSRAVVNSFEDSDRFNIIGNIDTEEEMKNALDSGKASVAVVIPPRFMRDVKKQHPSEILICVDGSNMVIANAVTTSALEIVQTISGGVGLKMIEGGGALPD